MANFQVPSLLVLCFTVVFTGCNVEAVSRFAGSCPRMEAVSFFNPNMFRGEWYEYGNFFPILDNINRCTKFMFSHPTHGVMSLELTGKNRLNFQSVKASGTAAMTGSRGSLAVKFPYLIPLPSEYKVLGTDYTSWAVLWTCQETVSGNIQNVIILTRQQAPYQYTINAALRNVDSKNLSRFSFMPVDQSYC